MLAKLHEDVQRDYANQKIENLNKLKIRKEEVQKLCPEIIDIDDKLKKLYPKLTFIALNGSEDEALEMKMLINRLLDDKKSILIKNNIEPDYVNKIYFCEKCKDTGLIEAGVRCQCYYNALSKKMLEMFKLTKKLNEENFETFSLDFFSKDKDPNTGVSPYDQINSNLKKIHSATKNSEDLENIYIYGDTGTGKTFLLNCIANKVLNMNNSIVYLPAQELLNIINAFKFNNNTHEFANAEFYNFLCSCDMLLIDDLGTEANTTFAQAEFFYLLDLRIRNKRATVISSNLGLGDLENNYNQRISSRIVGEFNLLKMSGTNIRISKKYGQNF
ncbi:MAG: ATP-binding protein [Lachnospirales bacterium]